MEGHRFRSREPRDQPRIGFDSIQPHRCRCPAIREVRRIAGFARSARPTPCSEPPIRSRPAFRDLSPCRWLVPRVRRRGSASGTSRPLRSLPQASRLLPRQPVP
jgi:hypothetical protein